MNFVTMLLAFAILCGIALFFCSILHVNMGEGMLLSSSLIVLLLFLSSLGGTFQYGMYGIFSVAAAGGCLWGYQAVRTRGKACSVFGSPVFLVLLFFYLCWLVLLYHDFIQHVDEFHQWAAAVKYMLEKDRLPVGYDFIGGGGQYGFATSLFHLFFQKLSGYNEQDMYVSSMLLSLIGFLLPFSEYRREDWKKVVLYAAIIYTGLFTLYVYGAKSLYVDVPTAAWAGGLAGWWMNRRKKKADVLAAACGLVMLHFFKQSAGLLMAVIVLLFMAVHTFVIERGAGCRKGTKTVTAVTASACALVLAGGLLGYLLILNVRFPGMETEDGVLTEDTVQKTEDGVLTEDAAQETETKWTVAGIELPEKLAESFALVQLSPDKAQDTLAGFVTKAFGSPMSSRANLGVAFVPFLLIVLLLFKIYGDLFDRKREGYVLACYAVFTALLYLFAVYFSFVLMFAYELSVELRSVNRYFSICSIYLLVLGLVALFQNKYAGKEPARQYVLLGILLFFTLQLNTKFIPNATAVDKENVNGYNKIEGTVSQMSKINAVLDEGDKVYLICQYPSDDLSGAELINASAAYYMEDKVSNYLMMPWRFSEEGSNVRLENSPVTLGDLPGILAQYSYTYLWIHTSDKYLARELPEVFSCEEVESAALYRVIYENGTVTGLEYVMSLEEEEDVA